MACHSFPGHDCQEDDRYTKMTTENLQHEEDDNGDGLISRRSLQRSYEGGGVCNELLSVPSSIKEKEIAYFHL